MSGESELVDVLEQTNYVKKKTRILDSKLKKLITVLTVLGIITGITAMQFMRLGLESGHEISLPQSMIKFMARNLCSGINATGHVIRTINAQNYTIVLDDWTVSVTRAYTAAFGIVNEETYNITCSRINVTGNISSYLQIWLHAHPRLICNATINDDDVLETSENKTLMWDRSLGSTTNYWIIGPGNGNVNDYKVEYPEDTATQYNCTWDGTRNIWVWNETERGWGLNDSNLADTVWVEIDVFAPTTLSTFTGNVTFYFEAVEVGEVS